MDEKIVLRMSYIYHEKLDVVVHDPDRCTILDIFIDLIEGALKNEMVLPAHPTLWYTYESQSYKLESDEDLMKMFNHFCEKKLIKLEIGSAEVPSKTLELARGLIQDKRNDISTTNEAQLLQNVIQPKSSHASNSSHSNSYGRKVPKTTAKRKGIFVPKVIPARILTSQPNYGNISTVGGAMQMNNLDVPSVNIGAALQRVEVGVQIDEARIVSPSSKDGCDPNNNSAFDNDTDEVYFDGLYDNGKPCEDNEFGKIKLTEWMFFLSREHLMDVIREYCIQEGFFIVVLKVDEERYTVVCGQEDCDWRIHSSRLVDGVTWAIKSLKDIHSCRRLNLHNPMATPEWASRKILEDVRKNEGVQGKDINDLLFKQFGIKMKPTSLYKARKLALDMIRGDDDTSFQNLPTYCEVLKSTNPGSMAHCVWKVVEESPEKPIQFKSIFISLRPMVGGFIQGCRRLIAVDGAHMKAKYNGVVLAACGLDGESQIFPIAFGVYENESTQTWSSFFHHLKDILKDANRDNWTIISDRQKGVEPSLEEVWPEAERRFCCQHLYANFKKLFPGELVKNCFWECCKAYSEFAFRNAMKKLEKIAGLGVVQWLKKVSDMKCWARFKYDPDLKSPETTSNWSESFNSTLGAERGLPILALLEGIRRTCMVRHVMRQEASQSYQSTNGITKSAEEKLKLALLSSRSCMAFRASLSEYEVKDGRSSMCVNLEIRTCSCGEWQISGIPCRHAMRAIIETRSQPETYVSHWYSIEMYRKTYSLNYSPVPDEEQWPQDNLPKLIPPIIKRGVGRPPKNRRRAQGKKPKGQRTRIVRCGKCKAFGHNSRTCKGGLTAKELKEQVGIRVVRRSRKKEKEMVNQEPTQPVDLVMNSAPWNPEIQ